MSGTERRSWSPRRRLSERADRPERSERPDRPDRPERAVDPDRDDRSDGRSLLVKNLNFETSPGQVRGLFEKFGPVRDVYLPQDYYTKRPRGFGFVEFVNAEDAYRALEKSHGTIIDGNEVTVLIAQDRRKSREAMRAMAGERSRGRNDYNRGSSWMDSRGYSRSPPRRHYRDGPYGSGRMDYRSQDAGYDRRGPRSAYDDSRFGYGRRERYDDSRSYRRPHHGDYGEERRTRERSRSADRGGDMSDRSRGNQ